MTACLQALTFLFQKRSGADLFPTKRMDALKVIEKFYEPDSKAYFFLVHHGKMVAQKALTLAQRVRHLNPDMKFVEEASLLHDIGIFLTNAPRIGCYGFKQYICHGYLGGELLDREGLPGHALVCERHVGVGITTDDIINNSLPLPLREMVPESIEEKIVCLSDKFFSKTEHDLLHEKPLDVVRKSVAAYGEQKLGILDEWLRMFGVK